MCNLDIYNDLGGHIMIDKKVIYDRYHLYAYISPFKDIDYEYVELFMDTNTLINVEQFIYNPIQLAEKNKLVWLSTMELLLDTVNKDTIYGFALQEACWDTNIGNLNLVQYENFENALSLLYDLNKEEIIQHAYSNGIKGRKNIERKKPQLLDTYSNNIQSNPLIGLSYASLLKLAELAKKKKKGNEIELCNEYLEFVAEELKSVQAIEFNMAMDLFLGDEDSRREIEKILKYRKANILHSVWNATWDIFFLRNLQLSYVHDLYETKRSKLLTADKGIIELSKYCNLRVGIKDKELGKSILEFNNDGIKPEFINYVNKIEKEVYFSSVDRMQEYESHKDNYQRIMKIIKRLEQSVLSS